MAARYWRTGVSEFRRSLFKKIMLRSIQQLIPQIESSDLLPGPAGVRAQAVDRAGRLLDDFCIERNGNVVHVLNAPSPAATASITIGRSIADQLVGTTA
jgi:L-2-hydroxyglutarate oxidase